MICFYSKSLVIREYGHSSNTVTHQIASSSLQLDLAATAEWQIRDCIAICKI